MWDRESLGGEVVEEETGAGTSWGLTIQRSGGEEAGRRNRKPPKESHKA